MQNLVVYVINLKDSTKRRHCISQQLEALGIEFNFFEAIDGKVNSEQYCNRYNHFKREWLTSGRPVLSGELGCYASHYALWKKCVELNKALVILEDDILLSKGAPEILVCLNDRIEQYGFVRLAPKVKGELITVEEEDGFTISWMTTNLNGAMAYALSPWAAAKFLKHSKSWSMAVDNYMGMSYIHKVESYLLSPPLATHPDLFDTTIQLPKPIKTPWYRKPTRELYSAYRKLRRALHKTHIINSRFKKNEF